MLIQRNSVVFPDPLGPITTTVRPRGTDNETPRNTWFSPNRFTTSRISSIGRASVTGKDPSLKVFSVARQCEAHAEIQKRGAEEDLERRQRAFHDLAACQGQFPQANDRDKRRRLDQIGAKADERRGGESKCLR